MREDRRQTNEEDEPRLVSHYPSSSFPEHAVSGGPLNCSQEVNE